jgi:hypothetical protein
VGHKLLRLTFVVLVELAIKTLAVNLAQQQWSLCERNQMTWQGKLAGRWESKTFFQTMFFFPQAAGHSGQVHRPACRGAECKGTAEPSYRRQANLEASAAKPESNTPELGAEGGVY